MMVSTKGRYALRIMLDLAQQEPGQYCSLSNVSCRQGMSVKYMEAIVAGLNRAGLLESQRGTGRRLPSALPAVGVYRRRDLEAGRGFPCPGGLLGMRRERLRAGRPVHDAADVAAAR